MNQNIRMYLKITVIIYGLLFAIGFAAWTIANYYLGIVPTMIFYGINGGAVGLLGFILLSVIAIIQISAYVIYRRTFGKAD